MNSIHTLRVRSEHQGGKSSAFFFPEVLIGDFVGGLPNTGLMITEREESEGNHILYQHAPTLILNHSSDRAELLIATTRREIYECLFSGIIVSINKLAHAQCCKYLDGEAEYYIVEKAMLDIVVIGGDAIQKISKKIPILEIYTERLPLFQIDTGISKVHVVMDHSSYEPMASELIDVQAPYYIPESEKVFFVLIARDEEEAEDPRKVNQAIIATYNKNKLKRLFRGAKISILEKGKSDNLRHSKALPDDVPLYLLEGIDVSHGFYVKDSYKDDIKSSKEERKSERIRAEEDFQRSMEMM